MSDSDRRRDDSDRRKTEITRLLKEWRKGNPDSLERLSALVYSELKRIARIQLARERRRDALQPTELVHEAFVKLVDQKADWQNRLHFYGIAAQAMRRILVDHARAKKAAKRPQEAVAVDLDQVDIGRPSGSDNILAIDQVLERLAKESPRQAQVAELKLFSELELTEIAELVGVSLATVKRDWSEAKKLLSAELNN